jgi:hypothetical protein
MKGIKRGKNIVDKSPLKVNYTNNISQKESIVHIDSLVNNYTSEYRHTYPFDSLRTKSALLKLRTNNDDTLKYYLTLLMIKKYKYQIECCRQGYELRDPNTLNKVGLDTLNNPILFEFLRFSKSYDHVGYPIDSLLNHRFEFMNSGIIMTWLQNEPKYLQNDSIKNYYTFIKDKDTKR